MMAILIQNVFKFKRMEKKNDSHWIINPGMDEVFALLLFSLIIM